MRKIAAVSPRLQLPRQADLRAPPRRVPAAARRASAARRLPGRGLAVGLVRAAGTSCRRAPSPRRPAGLAVAGAASGTTESVGLVKRVPLAQVDPPGGRTARVTAGLLARGSPPPAAFPGTSQWRLAEELPPTVAGTAAALPSRGAPHSLFAPRGDRQPILGPPARTCQRRTASRSAPRRANADAEPPRHAVAPPAESGLPPRAFPLNSPRRWSPQGAPRERGADSAAAPATVSGEPDPNATGAASPGKAGRRAATREPGDLPPARRNSSGPRAEGERTGHMTTTTTARDLRPPRRSLPARARRPASASSSSASSASRTSTPSTTPATTTGIRWPSPATEERPVT